jgi:hypothetical protein
MSAPTVRAGATDPREVEKLIARGVEAFTRRNLHAKVIVTDKSVIAGSANVSEHSQHVLDEAAIITNDQSAIRQAREFINRLCTEPIRAEYLELCKNRYRPPRFSGKPTKGKNSQQRAKPAKLWIVKLSEASLPESESKRFEHGKAEAEKKRSEDERRTEIESFWWPSEPKMSTELEFGDWIIRAMQYKDKTINVYPPGQFLHLDRYVRDPVSARERFVFYLEIPKRGEAMAWEEFRDAAKLLLTTAKLDSPRTRRVRDVQVADSLLALWTPRGRFAR